MRKDHQQVSGGEEEVNLTPMLDVVFIMLIFFIVTASFVKEAGIKVQQPTAVDTQTKPHASILVAVSPAGDIWISKRKVQLADVRPMIERLRAENPQGSIVVEADQDSQSGLVMDVVGEIKAAGVEDIALAAEKKS